MEPRQQLQIKIPVAVLFYAGIYAAIMQSVVLGALMVGTAFYAYRRLSPYGVWDD